MLMPVPVPVARAVINSWIGKITPSDVNGADVKPTSANTVDDIKKYLDSHGISYTSAMKKDDLLALVK